MIRKLALLAAGVLVSATAWADLPEGYHLELVTVNNPPLNMAPGNANFARDNDVKGVNTQIIRELMERAHLNYRITLGNPWSMVYTMAKNTPNTILFSVIKSLHRASSFQWVGPISTNDVIAVAKKSRHLKVANITDLAAYKVATYEGGYTDDFLRDQGIPHSTSIGNQSTLQRLMDGDIDIWVTYEQALPYYAKKANVDLDDVETVLKLQDTKQYLAVNNATPDEVVNRLRVALGQMQRDGTLDKIKQNFALSQFAAPENGLSTSQN